MRSLDKEIKKQTNILLVDAYNIINSWERFKSIKSLEDQRRLLIDIMESYQAYTRAYLVLVFDSYNVKTDRQVVFNNNLVLIYTDQHETADHFIEMLAHRYAKGRNLKVASSDRIEQEVILSKGATRLSAKELEILVDQSQADIKKTIQLTNTKNTLHLGGLSDEEMKKLEKIQLSKSKNREVK